MITNEVARLPGLVLGEYPPRPIPDPGLTRVLNAVTRSSADVLNYKTSLRGSGFSARSSIEGNMLVRARFAVVDFRRANEGTYYQTGKLVDREIPTVCFVGLDS